MPIVTWSDELSVNIKEVDSQHKGLVDLVNELYDAMSAGKGSATLGNILSELVKYTQIHFADEEKIMADNQYPGLPAHKIMHDNLTKQVVDFKNQFDAGKAVVSIEIMKFLRDWLANHIEGADKAFMPFLNNKGIF